MPIIVYSTINTASMHIASIIRKKFPELVPHMVEGKEQVTHTRTDFDTDCIIVPSTHKSASAKPALTAHVSGNWAEAEMGGEAKTLSNCSPMRMKTALNAISREVKARGLEIEVTLEADHHGPSSPVPILFVEVGSDETSWNNLEYCEIAAIAVKEAFFATAKPTSSSCKVVFGVGGGHYPRAFTKMELGDEYCFSHILPKYQIDALEFGMFRQAIEKSMPKAELVLIEKDGVNARQRDKIIGFCKDAGIGHVLV